MSRQQERSSGFPTYAVITPVRTEACNLRRLERSLAAQTVRPSSWVIVDNGSDDETPELIAAFARAHSWVRPVTMAGASTPTRGAIVAAAFEEGLNALESSLEIIVKVDADVSLPRTYFEDLLPKFDDPRLGIASGSRHEYENDRWRQRFVTGNTAEAQCRAYRRACLDAVLPFERRIGWDAVDEALAAADGWRTRTFRDIPFFHHRPIAGRDRSKIRAWHLQGAAMHYIGYRAYYVALRALFNARLQPQAIALVSGFLAAAVRRSDRHPNAAVTSYFSRQQRIANLPARAREALGGESSRSRPRKRSELLLVCQPGGHLLELIALHDVWLASGRVWVTLPTIDARHLLSDEDVVWGHGPTPRNVVNLFRNTALAVRVVRARRPRVVLTTGAGLAVPFAWVGRLFGASIVYVECAGRVSGLSLSCLLIAPVAERIYVQWPEQDRLVPRARYVGNIDTLGATLKFIPPTTIQSCPEVVVTIGTSKIPFDRLVRAAGDLACEGGVLVQCGVSTSRPSGAKCVDYVPFPDLVGLMRGARAVVTHGGVGSITLALACGKRPIVMPRRGHLGEHVDDHQLAYVDKIAELGLISIVETPEALRAAVGEACDARPPRERSGPDLVRELCSGPDLVRELLDYIRDSNARRAEPSGSR